MSRSLLSWGRVVAAFALALAACAADGNGIDLVPPTAPIGPDGTAVGIPWQAPPAVIESVAQIMARQARTPPGPPRVFDIDEKEDDISLPQAPGALPLSQWPPPESLPTLTPPAPRNPQTVASKFKGPTVSDTPGYYPPDTMGAAGPTQFLVFVNGRLRSYNKSTGAADGILNVDPDVFFASVITPGSSTSDPGVTYDPLSSRWFLTIIDVASKNRVLIAVSTEANITSSTNFVFNGFQADATRFADYPRHGVDANALYIGVNMFGGTYAGTKGFVIRKSSLFTTGGAVVFAFTLATATGSGPYTPIGVGNDDASATEGYFVGVDNAAQGLLAVRRVSTPGGTPTLSANIPVTVLTTATPANVTVFGSSTVLDVVDRRLGSARLKNGSLWAVHTNRLNSSGAASSSGDRNGLRWYELTNMTTTPTMNQAGTLFDASASSPKSYWMGSIMANGNNQVLLASSYGGALDRPGVALSGRLPSDPAGTMMPPALDTDGDQFTYNAGTQSGRLRWGDYTSTTLDPDNTTLWTIQEFVSANNIWAVEVYNMTAPPITTPCGSDSDCPYGSMCSGTSCVTNLADGAACTRASQCKSQSCAATCATCAGNWSTPLITSAGGPLGGNVSGVWSDNGWTFTASDSQVIGVNSADGTMLPGFPQNAGGPIENFPIVAQLLDGRWYVLFTSQDGFLYRVDIANPANVVSVDLRRASCNTGSNQDSIQGTPAVQLNAAVVGGNKDVVILASHHGCGDTTGNEIFALDAANLTGARLWTTPASSRGFASEGGSIDYSTNTIYIGTDQSVGGQNSVWAINTLTGAVRWALPFGSVHNRPQLGRGTLKHLFVANMTGTLYAINSTTGATDWSFNVGGGSVPNNIWAEFRGTFANTVFFTNSANGTEWAINDTGTCATCNSVRWGPLSLGANAVTAPSVWASQGKLYLGCDNGTVGEVDIMTQAVKTRVITQSTVARSSNVCSEPSFAVEGGATDVNKVITGVNGNYGTFARQLCVPF